MNRVSFDNLEDYGEEIEKVFKKVVSLYEEANGEPEPRPMINCPLCTEKTNNYACAYFYNKHVHFRCEHCGLLLMQ